MSARRRLRAAVALAGTCAAGFVSALVLAEPGSGRTADLTVPSLPLTGSLPVTVTLPTVPSVPTATLPTTTSTGTEPGTSTAGTGRGTTSPGTTTAANPTVTTEGAPPRCRNRAGRPDSRCTPGAAVGLTLRRACARTRHLPAPGGALRRAVLADYGVAPREAALYRIDRLVSVHLGGTNARRNLWPQPLRGKPGAREKRWLDARLLSSVCSGRMSLAAARRAVSHDWIAAYRTLHR